MNQTIGTAHIDVRGGTNDVDIKRALTNVKYKVSGAQDCLSFSGATNVLEVSEQGQGAIIHTNGDTCR